MPTIATSPTQLTLYADDGYSSHVVRFLLHEKHLPHHLIYIKDECPEALAELNPYRSLPILTQRTLALYEINVIFEYLEDRYKAYALLPNDPQQKAQIRLLAWRLQKDWLSLAKVLLTHPDSFDKHAADHAKKTLSDSLVTLSPLFARHEFFMSATFGWCDVLLAPLLWRLPMMDIALPTSLCQPLIAYQKRLFDRPTFQLSLAPPTQEYDDEY